MPIVFAHGQPKSGSTFLFQVARRAASLQDRLGERELRQALSDALGEPWRDFQQTVDRALIDRLRARIPPRLTVVIKTHGDLDPALMPLLARQQVRAFTSVRDPRDTALSMVDTGQRDAAHGKPRPYFKAMRTVTQPETLNAQRWAVRRLGPIVGNPFVLTIPHEAIAAAQPRVVRLLLRHLGLERQAREVNAHFASDPHGRIMEYHRGEPLRFRRELTADEVATLDRELAAEIAVVDAITRRAMARLSLTNAHLALRAPRPAGRC
ncbi:hypothetical protein [Acuticoccus sp.]|uniref:hypothetical protein n=1 Tax=Acuticoccus sp. TaxID=1904378 RepID=UPI003B5216E7